MSTDAEFESFIGRNARYYLKRFRAFASEGSRYYDANMAAALFSYIWVAYRRMYKWLPVVAAIDLGCLGLSIVLKHFGPLVYGNPGQLLLVLLMVIGSRFFLMGTFADYVYYRFCLSELSKQQKGQGHSKGGVSPMSALMAVVVIMAFAFLWQEANKPAHRDSQSLRLTAPR